MINESPEKEDRIHYLYRITNTINDKIYIGQTVNGNERWIQHKRAARLDKPIQIISRAIKKYKPSSFKFEIIASCKTLDDVNEIETILIRQFNSLSPNGYNVAAGGSNAPKTKEIIDKMKRTGEESGNSKLTTKQVLEIVKLCKEEHLSHRKVAQKFNVVSATIDAIMAGKNWSNLTKIKQKNVIRPVKLTSDQILEIVKLYKELNLSQKEIAKKFNIHRKTVGKILFGKLNSHITGITKDNFISPYLIEDQVLEIVKLHNNEQLSRKEIAKKFNISKSTVNAILTGTNWPYLTGIKKSISFIQLTSVQVLEIVKLHKESKLNKKQLAEKFNINQSKIDAILSGKSWSYITGIKKIPSFKPLTSNQVLEIVRLYNEENLSQQEIAKKFNVNRTAISAIITGRNWSHITGIKKYTTSS